MSRRTAAMLALSLVCFACGSGSRPFTPSPLRAGFPLFVSIPGHEPATGQVLQIDLQDDGTYRQKVLISALNFPSGLVVGPTGLLYVTENLANSAGTILSIDPAADSPQAEIFVNLLERPTRLAMDSFGRLHASTSDGIFLVSIDGELTPFLPDDSLAGGGAFDERDRLFMIDSERGEIATVLPDGSRNKFALFSDAANGLDLQAPTGIAIGSGSVAFVLDRRGSQTDGRILEFRSSGERAVVAEGFVNPVAIALEDMTIPYVAESTPAFRIVRYIQTLDATIKVSDLPGEPFDLAFSPMQNDGETLPDPTNGTPVR